MLRRVLFSFILISSNHWIPTQSTETGCPIPKFPKHGKLEVVGFENSNSYISGNYVDESTVISVKCKNGYSVKGNTFSFCMNGKWNDPIGDCSAVCHPLINTSTYSVSCNLNGEKGDCGSPVDGTRAQFKCEKYYEAPEILAERVCNQGRWNLPIPNCQPECGTRPVIDVFQNDLSPTEHPWHLGIYTKRNETHFTYRCGGTLISPNVMLTVPMCVSEKTLKDVVIVAGKYYTEFGDPRDTLTQTTTPKNVSIPPVYKGEDLNYVGSVAVVTLEKPFTLNDRVKPICIDFADKYRNELVNPRVTGTVYGWGLGRDGNLAQKLRRVAAPIIAEAECLEKVPEDYMKYVTYDKICAGFPNDTEGVCRGFTGGALAVQNQRDGKFYGVGVVAQAPVSKILSCGSEPLAQYANFYEYLSLIREVVGEQNRVRNANSGCFLPKHPENGRWVLQDKTSKKPGHRVVPGSSLKITCRDERYEIVGNPVASCNLDQNWSNDLGKCQIFCPPLVSTDILKVSCNDRNGANVSCSKVESGTRANFKCAAFHTLDIEYSGKSDKVECFEGSWGVKKYKCSPVCGIKPDSSNSKIYPWHVAIYRKYDGEQQYACGGTLIAQNVILSVGHCFADITGKNRTIDKEGITVGVGKYYVDINRTEPGAQLSKVKELHISRMFKGVDLVFLGDLAVLITEKTFPLSDRIQPICMDWDRDYKDELIKPGAIGHLPGWGYDISGRLPDTLKAAIVPILTRESCYEYLTEIRTYLTYEKICAGFNNGSAPQVCGGDSGGGLAVKNPANGRFYLAALLSVAERDKTTGCGAKPVALYTNIYEHMKCVASTLRRMNQNPKDKESCVLPPHPDNGKWSLYGVVGEFSPGEDVDSGVNLFVNCDDPYEVNGNPSALCHNGTWSNNISTCDLFCPPLAENPATSVHCSAPNGEKVSCLKPTDRTVANFSCDSFHELFTDQYGKKSPPDHLVLTCNNGEWNKQVPKCVPICGQKTVEPELLVINGSIAPINDYPWQAIVYLVDGKTPKRRFNCGGSLLSRKFVMTAAHCVTSSDGSAKPSDSFEVAVGKHFRKFDEAMDTRAQFSRVESIDLPSFYRGEDQNYLADVAILTMKTAFELSKRVQPVCIDWSQNIIGKILMQPNLKGFVSGWGYTEESGAPSDELKEVEVPFIPQAQCKERLPQEFLIFFTHDKLCAGFYQQSTGVCKGDSGGALVFKNKKNGRYYATGIVSVTPKSPTGICDSQRYTLYTHVHSYINFVQGVTNLMP